MLSILSYSLGPLYVLLGGVSVHVLCPIFNWVVYFPGVELCEFFINFVDQTLFEVSLANMFSHIVGSLFILMLFSSAVQKLFYFDGIPFVYFLL